MRRPGKSKSHKPSSESLRLIHLAQASVTAGSRIEQRLWERQLDQALHRQMTGNHQNHIDGALEFLFSSAPAAYEALMDAAESSSESCSVEHHGATYDALLVALPVLAWTRYTIASGPITPDVAASLSAQLHGHLLAPGVKLSLAPTMYAIDQLPRDHASTYTLLQRMAACALDGKPVKGPAEAPETAPFLADVRYFLAALVVEPGGAFFRWQTAAPGTDILAERETAFDHWRLQIKPSVERLLPGCAIEMLLPEAYFVACREADKCIRPISVQAAVHYLTQLLSLDPSGLSAIIGGFASDESGEQIEEYRISFTQRQQSEVIYGIIWPLYGEESGEEEPLDSLMARELIAGKPDQPEDQTPMQQIIGLLREAGITDIRHHHELFAMEFCDDCGTPLFCDADAELTHPEMPDEAAAPSHLH